MAIPCESKIIEQIEATKLVEKLLKREGISKKYKKELLYRKHIAKEKLLKFSFWKWMTTFPEASHIQVISYLGKVKKKNIKQMIPKIIHYCWLSTDPYPGNIKRCMNSWQKHLPDYEFIHWNFDRFPRGKSKWVDQAFESHKYAFAADYIRLYALYHYGGIYLDTDVEVLKSFDDLLDLPYFIGKEPSETGVEAAVLGAEKGNLLISDMLDSYQDRSFLLPEGDMDVMPLPYKIRACIESQYHYHPIQKKEEFINNEDYINVFPEDFFLQKISIL